MGVDEIDARVTWDFDWSDDLDHFDVYVGRDGGDRVLVGQTRGEAFYIPGIAREGLEDWVNVEVVPVTKDQVQHTPVATHALFDAAGAPAVTFKLTRNYVKVGEEVTVSATGTYSPTGWKWVIPEGLEPVSESLTESSVTVMAKAEGRYSLTVEATNDMGTSVTTCELIEVLSDEGYAQVQNVAAHKTIVSCSNINPGYSTSSLVNDDLDDPYLRFSNPFRSDDKSTVIVIDLGSTYRIYGFNIYDGKFAGSHKNYVSHTIELSLDGETWVKKVEEDGLADVTIKECYINPSRARYIRFTPSIDKGKVNIWEFQAFGVEDKSMALVELDVNPAELSLNAGEESDIIVTYDYNGTMRDENFAVTATAGGNIISIGDIEDNAVDLQVVIPVAAKGMMGTTEIVVRAVNGESQAEVRVPVVVDDLSRPNVLAGLDAKVRRYKVDYSPVAEYDTFTTGALTDGDTSKEALEMIEDPSTHKNDVWAIFEAPEKWNLSKVKVHFPGENYGANDNGKDGAVNNSISIAVGDDIDNLVVIKTFENLDRIASLTYILPELKETKYVAVACNLNPFFYPSLAEVEAFEQNMDAIPVSGPVEIANWEHDVIAEAKPASEHTNYTLDDQGWVLYSASVQAAGSVAGDDRTIVTTNGTVFRFAPYDGNNATVFKEAGVEKTLKLATPMQCDEVQLLAISANGISGLQVRANYADGTSGEAETFNTEDWYGDAAGTAYHGLSRISSTSGNIDSRMNFRLYEHSLVTDGSKKLESLSVTSKLNGSYPAVLAVSRTGRRASSSVELENVTTGTSPRQVEAMYNLQGIRVANTATPGIYIVRYTDGTTAKIAVK